MKVSGVCVFYQGVWNSASTFRNDYITKSAFLSLLFSSFSLTRVSSTVHFAKMQVDPTKYLTEIGKLLLCFFFQVMFAASLSKVMISVETSRVF